MKPKTIIAIAVGSAFAVTHSSFGQGALTPPGAPAPTMKTLDQIEARTPINTVPFTISNPGSYYFTTNVNAIGVLTVNADNVTIDLNGFTFTGPPGAGSGILMSTAHSNLCVRNGTIAGRSGVAISCSTSVNSHLSDLRILGNGSGGIVIGEGSVIERCEARNNTGVGISTTDRCILRDCTATANTSHGIATGNGVLVQNCVSAGNSALGISCNDNCTLDRCTVSANLSGGVLSGNGGSFLGCSFERNTAVGLSLGEDSTVRDCTVTGNSSDGVLGHRGAFISDCTVVSNAANGLNLFQNCTVVNCSVNANTLDGIFGDPADRVSGCTVMDNRNIGIDVTDGSSVVDCNVGNNYADGIRVSSFCLVQGNNCTGNGLNDTNAPAGGIHAIGSTARIDGNHCANNLYGLLVDTTGGANVVIRNSFLSNTADTSIATGNKIGPVVSDPTSASANPWANLAF